MFRKFLCLVLITLSKSAFAAADQWIEVQSPHFTLYSDASEKQARHTLDQLERMRWLYQTLFPKANVDPAEPIIVVAARNEKTFQAMEPAPYLKKGALNLGGYFLKLPDKNYILLRLDATTEHPFATVYHEYTHLQFAADGEWLPLWFEEGIAEFFENTDIRDKDVLLGQPSANDILYLRQASTIPLRTLLAIDHNSPYYHEDNKGSVFYAESWALTHMLMMTDRQNHVHRMQDYLELASKHEDPVVAGEKAFGDLKRMELELSSYIKDGRYQEFLVSSAAATIDESAYKVKAITDTQAQAIKADVLVYAERTDEARTLLDSILKTDPNNVQALETMGYLANKAGNQEEALKWYGQALKTDPHDFLVCYHYASLAARAPGGGDDQQVETSLRQVIQLAPRFAPAYDLLAEYYARRHENLEEAHLLNAKAVQLEPGNVYFRVNSANVLLAAGKYADALSVLNSALKVAKNPQQTSMVQNSIEQVQSFEAERARMEAENQAMNADAKPVKMEVYVDNMPKLKHPTMPAGGPKHVADGVIKGVACTPPAALEFQLAGKSKTFALYMNDYFKLELSVLNFTPSGSMDPCSDFEGMKAKVEYIDSSDTTVDGQIVSVELRK